jgi:phosphatidate cytidylyltransferase
VTVVPGQTALRRRSDLATRALAGGAMIVVAVLALWLGGIAFWLLSGVLALLMLAEWAGLMRGSPRQILLALLLFALALWFVRPAAGGVDRDAVALLVCAALLVTMLGGSGRLGFGLLYAGLPTAGLIFLREQPAGVAYTLWTLAIVWATDIGAYFAGRAIGGAKLAPRLSPNKTWAGLFGGMAGALVVGAMLATVGGLPATCYWLAPLLAVLAQMGDLFESWLKRKAGVKDSGRLLPGHGGALDRLDGVVPVAVLVAALVAGGAL